jgi:hypothetical protein
MTAELRNKTADRGTPRAGHARPLQQSRHHAHGQRLAEPDRAAAGQAAAGAVRRKVSAEAQCAPHTVQRRRQISLPFENEVNVKEDLKSEQIADMKISFVKSMEEVVELALEK